MKGYYVLSSALRSQNSYVLNGDFIISMQPTKIEVPGAVLFYSGTEVVEESINSTGTLLEPLQLQVLIFTVILLFPTQSQIFTTLRNIVNRNHHFSNILVCVFCKFPNDKFRLFQIQRVCRRQFQM